MRVVPRGFLEAAERLMVRWHVEEAKNNSERCAARMHGAQSRRGAGGSRETAVAESKTETADRVARRQADRYKEPVHVTSSNYCGDASKCTLLQIALALLGVLNLFTASRDVDVDLTLTRIIKSVVTGQASVTL